MSTITIDQMLRSNALKQDQLFNSLAATYAGTKLKNCGNCRKPTASLNTCKTLLSSLITKKRSILESEFNIPPEAVLTAFVADKTLGIRISRPGT